MDRQQLPLSFQESVVYSLRALYEKFGYDRYKMSKFEEYDLYAHNKDFLISDNVITFTDTNGKLMALKPDVTLSIVKKSSFSSGIQKLYYNENVYRVTKGTKSFQEMMQVGLECLGQIDDYCISEVLLLAARSLNTISDNWILSVSHIGLLCQIFSALGIEENAQSKLLDYIGEKNCHEAVRYCSEHGVSAEGLQVIERLTLMSGCSEKVLADLSDLLAGVVESEYLDALRRVLSVFNSSPFKDKIRIDFSVVDNIHYYNAIVFKGFVSNVPGSVLSGGQYDKLMRKMGRKENAIGFAVYMDMLEQLEDSAEEYDVDVALLYDSTSSLVSIHTLVEQMQQKGSSVLVQQKVPEGVRYRRLLRFNGSEVICVEPDA